jgi:hypothetical protein
VKVPAYLEIFIEPGLSLICFCYAPASQLLAAGYGGQRQVLHANMSFIFISTAYLGRTENMEI